jgi:transglutaminase-like putative cysteine protease
MNKPNIIDLRWLLGSLALVMALHVSHLAIWVSIFIAAFGVWRYLIEKNGWQLPRLLVLLPITVVAGLGIALTYRGIFGRDASVALLAIMLSLKLMETKTPRDYILVIFSGFFLTITAFLFNQSLLVGAFILLPTICLIATLIGVSHPNGNLGWRFQTKLAGSLLAQATPVMLVLFFLFPRIPGPLWGVPKDAYSGMAGLSDSMHPGIISKLTLSGAIAFRVQFKDKIPPQNQLYWRGPVLWHYVDGEWLMNGQEQNTPRETLRVQGTPTLYSVTLEPHNRKWLLMLDMPTTLPPNTLVSRDLQVLSPTPVRTRMRYEGSSSLNYTLAENLSDRDRGLALQIPDDENPRSIALAKLWTKQGAKQGARQTPEAIVQSALTMFRQESFVYTLSPPTLGLNPIDDFLFNTRRGFCEHYASSFVYLMRAAGVPARVVTGYQGGDVNPVGNYLIVRQSDAHAWAEVWLQGRGWVRVDPTAAVAPSRIEFGIATALPEGDVLPLMSRRDYPLLRKIYLNWDALNNGWNQYVLGYNQERQINLLSRLIGSQVSWQDLAIAMMACVGAVGLAISYFLLRGKRIKIDPLQRLYAEFLRKLEGAGLKRYSHEGPLDFSKRAVKRLPTKANEIAEITDLYADLRYRSNTSALAFAYFKRQVRKFK